MGDLSYANLGTELKFDCSHLETNLRSSIADLCNTIVNNAISVRGGVYPNTAVDSGPYLTGPYITKIDEDGDAWISISDDGAEFEPLEAPIRRYKLKYR